MNFRSPFWTPFGSQHGGQGHQKPSQNRGPKKHQTIVIFSTPECGQSVVNRSNINDFKVLMLAPFWVSFWRYFGSPNGGQSHQKAISKKHQKNDAQNDLKLAPKGVSKWSQNRKKNEVLEAPCFKGRSQVASRATPGSILERFWDHFGTMFANFSNILLVIVACIM